MAEERQAGSFKITSHVTGGSPAMTADTDLFGTRDGRIVTDGNDPAAHELIARKGQAIHPRHAELYGLKEGTGKVAQAGKKVGEVVPSTAPGVKPAEAAPARQAAAPGPEAEPERETRRGGSVTIENAAKK